MRLLVFTQTINRNDLYLGFFERWVAELAKEVDEVVVVCLKKGPYSLPTNVTVLSLGKEEGVGRLTYLLRFYKYIFSRQYDTVFVHMNQEYVLLGGLLWRLMGKKVFMWRNHYAGSWLTDLAAKFCHKVFCTSKHSYTAKYKHTVLMPVGVDTVLYKPVGVTREPRSILFYARMAPSKRPDVLIEALGLLHARGVQFKATLYGSALPQDKLFLTELKNRVGALGLINQVTFMPGAPHSEGPAIFSAHTIYVDPSRSGMYNKMLFEAAACGCVVLAVSDDWAALVGEEFAFTPTPEALAAALEPLLDLTPAQLAECRTYLAQAVERHSLTTLAQQLVDEMALVQ